MRNITITCLLIYVINILPVAAFEIEFEETFGDNNSVSTIQILSSTDSERFRPVINGFIKRNPELSVRANS